MGGAIPGNREMLFVGPLGAGFSRGDLLEAARDGDIQVAAGGAHDQGRAGGNGERTAGGQGRSFLVGGRQNDRRPAGVQRRRDPGIDANIARRQHPVPVEGGAKPHRTLIAGGEEGRNQHHHDQRAQRPGVVKREPGVWYTGADALEEASVRSRCACHSACATGSCEVSVSVSVVAGR